MSNSNDSRYGEPRNEQLKEMFRNQKWTTRLINIPEVIWKENIVKMLTTLELRVPRFEFDVYKFIDIEPFVAKANNSFRTAMIGYCLAFVGIKLDFEKNEDGSKNYSKITASIVEDKMEFAVETVKALNRKENAVAAYKQFAEENLAHFTKVAPANQIVDVAARNSQETGE